MEIKIPNIFLKELAEKTDEFFNTFHRSYGRETDIISIDCNVLKDKLKVLKDFLATKKTDRDCINALNQLKRYESIIQDVDKAVIKDLKQFESAVKVKVDESPRKWIWRKNSDGIMLPYFVYDCEYKRIKAEAGESAAYIQMRIYSIHKSERDFKKESTYISIYASYFREDKKQKTFTLQDIASDADFYFDNDTLYNEYENSMRAFEKLQNETGKQFLAKGKGKPSSSSSWYNRYNFINLVKAGVQSRLVIDEMGNREIVDNHTDCKTWKGDVFEIPIHPYLNMYDLTDHQDLIVHVDLIEDYKYNKSVIDKIVIKPEQRDLLDILCASDDNLMEDIIQGKTGGIIVMCSGVAGVGKTLTAEVYSEYMEKPLYKVQSSQLGITVDEVEGKLKSALDRASRWKAIMLIDEADTYIHERGNDIVQNCIVGVFLRMLEYYKGVLFMTTNKATIIDDAIISRCIAHLKYELPDAEELKRIWKILSEQFNVKIADKDIDGIVKSNTDKGIHMSGRDVKNTLKLLKKVADKKEKPISLEMFNSVSKFMNYSNK